MCANANREEHKYKMIYENQLAAAGEIISHFRDGERHGILKAQMQSGKTGVFMAVARGMIGRNLVDKVIIMSGNQEIAMREQIKHELHTLVPEIAQHTRVCWGAGLESRAVIDEISDSTRVLFIIDESHAAQDRKSRPAEFFRQVGLNPRACTESEIQMRKRRREEAFMQEGVAVAINSANSLEDGNIHDPFIERDMYVLSVSATPFAEMSELYYQTSVRKFVVILTPGEGYIGVRTLLRNRSIRFIQDIDDIESSLIDVMQEAQQGYNGEIDRCWAIVRATSVEEIRTIIPELVHTCPDWSFATHISNASLTDWPNLPSLDILRNRPVRPTLIWIVGKCRMGSVIPKAHIKFCMETSNKPDTDTLLQGLIGRMCGYHMNDRLTIYISYHSCVHSELGQYIQFMCHTEAHHMPQRGSSLVKACPSLPRAVRVSTHGSRKGCAMRITAVKEGKTPKPFTHASIVPIVCTNLAEDDYMSAAATAVVQNAERIALNKTSTDYIVSQVFDAMLNKAESVINHNSEDHLNKVVDFIEEVIENDFSADENCKQIQIWPIGGQGHLKSANQSLSRQLFEAIRTRTPKQIGHRIGLGHLFSPNCHILHMWWFTDDSMNEYGFHKNDIVMNTLVPDVQNNAEQEPAATESESEREERFHPPLTTGQTSHRIAHVKPVVDNEYPTVVASAIIVSQPQTEEFVEAVPVNDVCEYVDVVEVSINAAEVCIAENL